MGPRHGPPARRKPWEERAARVLREIAAQVARAEPARLALADGAAGMAVFLAYYGAAEGDERAGARAGELLESACARSAEGPTPPDLFRGLSGVAWAAEHLTGGGEDEGDDEDDPNDGVDRSLAEILGRPRWQGPFDLVSGLCGIAVYALERLPRPVAVTCLEHVVRHLEQLSEPVGAGLTWRTAPEHLPSAQRELTPAGHYNLGLAHGVPGVVATLARAVAAGVAEARAARLLGGGVRWLLDHQLRREDARYPPWIPASGPAPAEPTRTAWCYGDLSVASALLAAARASHEPAWEREAVGLARGAARRSADQTGVVDAGLCHGAFGLAHVFSRLSGATGDEELARAASAWIERGLAIRAPGRGVAGYAAHRGEAPPVADPGFLEGASGIGLALLSALTDVEPAWDAVLLIDCDPA